MLIEVPYIIFKYLYRLWKDVTTALRLRNVEAATEAKFQLEQKQREEAKNRLESKTKWETRVIFSNLMCNLH